MKLSTKTALFLAGIGALAVYKYNKMSDEEKQALKDKGKKLFDEHISPFLRNALGLAEDPEAFVEQEASIK